MPVTGVDQQPAGTGTPSRDDRRLLVLALLVAGLLVALALVAGERVAVLTLAGLAALWLTVVTTTGIGG